MVDFGRPLDSAYGPNSNEAVSHGADVNSSDGARLPDGFNPSHESRIDESGSLPKKKGVLKSLTGGLGKLPSKIGNFAKKHPLTVTGLAVAVGGAALVGACIVFGGPAGILLAGGVLAAVGVGMVVFDFAGGAGSTSQSSNQERLPQGEETANLPSIDPLPPSSPTESVAPTTSLDSLAQARSTTFDEAEETTLEEEDFIGPSETDRSLADSGRLESPADNDTATSSPPDTQEESEGIAERSESLLDSSDGIDEQVVDEAEVDSVASDAGESTPTTDTKKTSVFGQLRKAGTNFMREISTFITERSPSSSVEGTAPEGPDMDSIMSQLESQPEWQGFESELNMAAGRRAEVEAQLKASQVEGEESSSTEAESTQDAEMTPPPLPPRPGAPGEDVREALGQRRASLSDEESSAADMKTEQDAPPRPQSAPSSTPTERPPAPPPPPTRAASAPISRENLMSDIRKGKRLRSVNPEDVPKTPPPAEEGNRSMRDALADRLSQIEENLPTSDPEEEEERDEEEWM